MVRFDSVELPLANSQTDIEKINYLDDFPDIN
jgi:hypothetical protein